MLAAAENLAARAVLRQALEAPVPQVVREQSAAVADSVQSLSGASFVQVMDAEGRVVADTADPGRIGRRAVVPGGATGGGTVLAGRASVGDGTGDAAGGGGRAVVAFVPVFSEAPGRAGRLVGAVAVGQQYPTLVEYLI